MALKREMVDARAYSQEVVKMAISLYKLYRSYAKVGDILGVGESTICRWVQAYDADAAIRESYKADLSAMEKDALQNIQTVKDRALQQVYERLPEASAAQAATIYGILFDKEQILRGNAAAGNTNVFIDTAGMTDEDKAALLARALKRTQEPQPVETTAVEVD